MSMHPVTTAEVRLQLSHQFIEIQFRRHGTAVPFGESQGFLGYNEACDSWHAALWRWVDEITPPQIIAIDWYRLDPNRVEEERQKYLLRRAIFMLAMNGPEAEEPETYKDFVDVFQNAKLIADDSVFAALARQKQRKPTKDKGDRRLKHHLLMLWIPGCLWALTNEGAVSFLNSWYARSENRPYSVRALQRALFELKLFRAPKPLRREISGNPPRFAEL